MVTVFLVKRLVMNSEIGYALHTTHDLVTGMDRFKV